MTQSVRIIGGRWRGRKIQFPKVASIRPTPDRVRETLFNWLAPMIHDAVCLDLFAGSGALGLEALSRGAKHVTFVDASHVVCQHLREYHSLLNIENPDIVNSRVPNPNMRLNQPYDLIFLDPPFHKNLITKTLSWLEKQSCFTDNTLLYIETEQADLTLPPHYHLKKSGHAGSTHYYLCYLRFS